MEEELKAAAEISMGTDISEEDIENVTYLCEQIIQIAEYRMSLYDYLKNRMQAIAPNLTVLVGELVGARLIAHAGQLSKEKWFDENLLCGLFVFHGFHTQVFFIVFSRYFVIFDVSII